MKAFYNKNSAGGGIYKIVNTSNERIYIGKAKVFRQRFYEHKRKLKAGSHKNKFLQHDFTKCGESVFEFHVLEVVLEHRDRNKAEEKWIAKFYDGQKQCYNFQKKSDALPRSAHSNDPDITKKILSEKSKAMWANPKTRKKLLERKEAAMKTPEYKEALKEGLKKAWDNEERRKAQIDRMKKIHKKPGYTKKVIKKTIANRDEDKTRVTKTKNKLEFLKRRYETIKQETNWIGQDVPRAKMFEEANLLSPDGTLYKKIYNLNAFAKKFGIGDSWKLQEVIEGSRWQHKGWVKFKKFDEKMRENQSNVTWLQILKNNRTEALKTSRRSKPNVKVYGSLVDPNGKVYENVTNVPTFAKEHNLTKTSLYQLLLGKLKSHKKWKTK